ncbi:MAG: hypothetical protein EXQ83_08400 [Xanthobacteraceae bacterium]|nr:hypothetical protein [Xanthobacteraceae bacterium]
MFSKRDVALRSAVLVLPALLIAAPAASQTDRVANQPANSAPAPKIPEATIGHRQPNGSDVPKNIPKDAAELAQEKRDRELDAKLQICRGC